MIRFDAVILVEGLSDKAALETLAVRQGRDLESEGIVIHAMGGASPIGQNLRELTTRAVALAGLCDLAEEDDFARALDRHVGPVGDRSDMEALGFFVCVVDLEDELIRALGPERVLEVVASEKETGALSSFQNQPAWRGRPIEDQLRRFMGTFSGRKVRYGALLVEALDLDRVPRPLERVLNHL
jgi:hypothetical protein